MLIKSLMEDAFLKAVKDKMTGTLSERDDVLGHKYLGFKIKNSLNIPIVPSLNVLKPIQRNYIYNKWRKRMVKNSRFIS